MIQVNNGHDLLGSVGFLYEFKRKDDNGKAPLESGLADWTYRLMRNIILESWVSFPSNGQQEYFTIKLNYVIKF